MKLITADAAAKRLACSVSWLSRNRYTFDWIHKTGGRLKVEETGLNKYIESTKTINQVNPLWQLEKDQTAPIITTTLTLKEKGTKSPLAQAIKNLRKNLKAS